MIKIHGEPNVKTLEILKNLPRGIQKHLAHGLNMFLSPSQSEHLKVRKEICAEGLARSLFYSNLATYYLPQEGPAAFQDRMMKVQKVQDSKGPVWGNNIYCHTSPAMFALAMASP